MAFVCASRPRKERPSRRPLVIPCLNKFAQNLKNVALRYDVPLVLSAGCNLAQLCPRGANNKGKGPICWVKHDNNYVDCKVGVIYKILLVYKKINTYIVQTGRCVNHKWRERDLSLHSEMGSGMGGGAPAPLLYELWGRPIFKKAEIIGKSTHRLTPKMLEAYAIKKRRYEIRQSD